MDRKMSIDELLALFPDITVGGVARLAGYANGRQISVLRARGRTLPPERLRRFAESLHSMASKADEIVNGS